MLSVFASVAWAGVAGVQVTVSDHAGKLTYRGRTDASGAFVTPWVTPGDYVVQINSTDAFADRSDYAIFAAAGKHRVVANAVEGAKLRSGGIAMRLKVAAGTPIIGQIALGGVNALGTKIVNGKRFVLVQSETGSALGPRWVEERSASAHNVSRVTLDDPTMIKPAPGLWAH
ncbi:MAG: carboxypeptidase-like regulatory domain-containing protein [Chthoniobacterales bacterium]